MYLSQAHKYLHTRLGMGDQTIAQRGEEPGSSIRLFVGLNISNVTKGSALCRHYDPAFSPFLPLHPSSPYTALCENAAGSCVDAVRALAASGVMVP